MEFDDIELNEYGTDLILPRKYEFKEIKNSFIKYAVKGKTKLEEPLFLSDGSAIFPSSLRTEFENDSVIVILYKDEDVFLHKRSRSKNWEPGKIDLASIAGQRRAVIEEGKFEKEDIENTAMREISEETGICRDKLSKVKLKKIGHHYNPETDENQTIFIYEIDTNIEKLNQNAKEVKEVEKWIRQSYKLTLEEYFGEKVGKYAGGSELRPENFISSDEIRENIEDELNKERK